MLEVLLLVVLLPLMFVVSIALAIILFPAAATAGGRFNDWLEKRLGP
jgi:hypothetical protein